MMPCRSKLSTLLFLLPTLLCAAGVELTADRKVVASGTRVRLRWSGGGIGGYLIGFGKVGPSGETRVTVERSTTFLLIAHDGVAHHVAQCDVIIEGSKGGRDDFEPNLSLYKYPYERTVEKRDFGEFTDTLTKTLRDKFGFIIRHIDVSDDHIELQTNGWRTPGLQDGLKPQYAGRTISFLIDIFSSARRGSLAIKLRSLIDIKRVLEDTPYPETDTEIYHKQTIQLINSVIHLSGC